MPRRRSKTTPSGLIVIDKPVGLSSMDVVRHVRRAGRGVKTGHAGTLDPQATGVVICCLGRGTKQIETLMNRVKVYEATIDLAAFSATDDAEGERTPVEVSAPPTHESVAAACDQFVGRIEQVPPAHSAVHVNGKRAYELARAGESVDLPTREVSIASLELLRYAWPRLDLRVTCGKGTYIRSLARDLGSALRTGGHLTALRRTAVGEHTAEQAWPLDALPTPLTEQHLLELPATDRQQAIN